MKKMIHTTLLAGLLTAVFPATFATAQDDVKPNEAERPNILFAIADDASFPYMGAYGCKWVRTPNFDRVADQGILFINAYTPNAKCAPSRSCILTGRNTWQLEEACNHWPIFPTKFKSVWEAMSENGVFVGSTGKGWAPGFARDADGNNRLMTGKKYNAKSEKPPARGISGNDYAGNFADFLSEAPQDMPWCFWYGCTEPHRGYEFGSGVNKGGYSTDQIDKVPAFWPDNETIRNDMLDYAFELQHFDTHLGRMIDLLEERGELANTLIVVTADNGMPFPRIKGQEYEMSNHLPLAMMWPEGINSPGRKIEDYVSFADFAPTFVQLEGLDWDAIGMKPAAGKSLADILFSDKAGQVDPARNYVLFGKERHDVGRPDDQGYPIRAMIRDGYLYLHNFETDRWPAGDPITGYPNTDGSPTKTDVLNLRRSGENTDYWQACFGKRPADELYDINSDPECMNNLAASKPEIVSEMQKQLFAELKAQEDPRMFGDGEYFDRVLYADKSSHDMYNKIMRGEKVNAGWISPTDAEKEPLE